MSASYLVVIGVLCHVVSGSPTLRPDLLMAAVYEHVPESVSNSHVTADTALRIMEDNLNVYESQIRKAKSQGAEIIVFPESGLQGLQPTRDLLEPYLQDIPDPNKRRWDICDDPNSREISPLLQRLSCLAKKHKIYVVANMPEKQFCNTTVEPNCPADDEYYIFSTTVCLNDEGIFVAKYRACNLQEEQLNIFNRQYPCEYATVQTSFGRLGFGSGYDLLFRDPLITLVERYNVDHIVIPMSWVDHFPFQVAIGFQNSFAHSMSANVLAANLHIAHAHRSGSGVFSPQGPRSHRRSMASQQGRLLAGTIYRYPRGERSNIPLPPMWQTHPDAPRLDMLSTQNETVAIRKNIFNVREMDVMSPGFKTMKVCQKEFCCNLKYQVALPSPQKEIYAFGAFSNFYSHDFKLHMQICFVLKCTTPDLSTCGHPPHRSHTKFTNVTLNGAFTSKYMFSQVFGSDVQLITTNLSEGFGSLATNAPMKSPLLSVVMIERNYHMDYKTNGIPEQQRWGNTGSAGSVLPCHWVTSVTWLTVLTLTEYAVHFFH